LETERNELAEKGTNFLSGKAIVKKIKAGRRSQNRIPERGSYKLPFIRWLKLKNLSRQDTGLFLRSIPQKR
jgi:hypothetical protein